MKRGPGEELGLFPEDEGLDLASRDVGGSGASDPTSVGPFAAKDDAKAGRIPLAAPHSW